MTRGIVRILKSGGVGVLPTDTIYGIVGSALSRKAVQRIYRLRHRNTKKPMIVLIHGASGLEQFGVLLDKRIEWKLREFWPGRTSIIFPCRAKKFSYLHRGTKTVAFRVPKPKKLRELLFATGPLVAPSANYEGAPPAKTIREAKRYFGGAVDFYVDGGRIDRKPSSVLAFRGRKIKVIRK